MSKIDFLKRYAPKSKKRKSDKQPKCDTTNILSPTGNVRVIVKMDTSTQKPSSLKSNCGIMSDIEDDDQDAPLIAEIIDDRPDHLKLADEFFETRRWRAIETPSQTIECLSNKSNASNRCSLSQPLDLTLQMDSKIIAGERLSANKIRAAKLAAEYVDRISQSNNDVNQTKQGNNTKYKPELKNPVTSWRNLEAEPNCSFSLTRLNTQTGIGNDRKEQSMAKQIDSDSDLSLERPPDECVRTSQIESSRRSGKSVRKSVRMSSHFTTINDDNEHLRDERIERYKAWGRGLVQVGKFKKTFQELSDMKNQPLSRYKDDKELDEILKAQDREGDPMAAYIAQASSTDPNKSSSNCSTNIKSVEQSRKFSNCSATNRFSIKPGCRWDGVDRSNGFEQKLINIKAKTLSAAEHVYKWRVEDM